ncbi:macrophage mannose receptor 1-like [Neocloeon triangulifer]|uniref:macrophage mannose receptor 1-like n=1 Tax=Neocloeon triangulifer TaxID=2078957 RepID=UPI00286EF297|nr:macrophage mannose receptor 1-like [Neocloeon triangulifer]
MDLWRPKNLAEMRELTVAVNYSPERVVSVIGFSRYYSTGSEVWCDSQGTTVLTENVYAPGGYPGYGCKDTILIGKASWFDASSFCIARGMDFLSIETKEEFEFVAGQILASGLQNENVWIGGTEIGSENSYYWVHTNSPVELSYWDPTEVPAVANRCMVFNKSLWRHAACSALNYFVCETLEDATTSSTPLQDFSE